MLKLVITAALALVLSSLAAGCGDKTTAAELSASEWRRDVTTICRRTARGVRGTTVPKAVSGVSPFVARTSPLWKRELDDIRALRAPPSIAPRATDYSTAVSYFTEALVEAHIGAERGDGSRVVDAFGKADRAAADIKARALDLGVPACARRRIP